MHRWPPRATALQVAHTSNENASPQQHNAHYLLLRSLPFHSPALPFLLVGLLPARSLLLARNNHLFLLDSLSESPFERTWLTSHPFGVDDRPRHGIPREHTNCREQLCAAGRLVSPAHSYCCLADHLLKKKLELLDDFWGLCTCLAPQNGPLVGNTASRVCELQAT
jgi:hypothetical protein